MGGALENRSIRSEDVRDMLSFIEDGFLFENFSHEYLTARLGYRFVGVGGIKDRGIDGLEYASNDESRTDIIYQISIAKNPKQKLVDTINKLKANSVNCRQLIYVTNLIVSNKDTIIDELLDQHGINIRIFDSKWISDGCNESPATQTVITNFISRHLRQYQRPGNEYIVSDHVKDPRLYVFLMQQVGNHDLKNEINNKLIDTLIIYSLRDTDPERNILMTADEIESAVRGMFEFEIERLRSKINKRLKILSNKPNRRINQHTISNSNSYCLPYESRLEIAAANLRDKELYESFMKESEEVIKDKLKHESVTVRRLTDVLKKIVEQIYYKQGLEFSDVLLNGAHSDLFESNLSETVDLVLNHSNIVEGNRNKVKTALIMAIRQIVYSGSQQTKEYLKSLSKTYLMLFLLKCDPKIIGYFSEMASSMKIFVCTSIIVPALSEVYLEGQNRRYWNLLKSAKSRGVKLLVNDTILNELLFHIKNSFTIFESEYKDNIDTYAKGSEDFIDQILIRSFLYAKNENKVNTYKSYLNNFVSIDSKTIKQELIDFLSEEFGIEYISPSTPGMNTEVNQEDLDKLITHLSKIKGSTPKARADAELILTIYKLREINGEISSSFEGYRTWWLSSDTATHKAVSTLFNQKYPVSCYMRPDFLYNYISFTPCKDKVCTLYESTFPNLLGVQISNHISKNIGKDVRRLILEHSSLPAGRVKGIIRSLVDKLKEHTGLDYEDKLNSFFNDLE